jgi:hypothetical protein
MKRGKKAAADATLRKQNSQNVHAEQPGDRKNNP